MNAATNTDYGEMRSIPETRELIKGAIAECLAVGRALGAPVMDDSLDWAMTSLDNFPAQGRASLVKDFPRGQPGGTGRPHRRRGPPGPTSRRPHPLNDAIYAILKPWRCGIEAGLKLLKAVNKVKHG